MASTFATDETIINSLVPLNSGENTELNNYIEPEFLSAIDNLILHERNSAEDVETEVNMYNTTRDLVTN
jgi:hypothetical protein